jgi:spectinomycin phosphotransferase
MVVTHGEPHPGNLIQTSAGLVLIDWDTVAVARRRDADGEHALRGLRSILSGAEPSPYSQRATWRRATGDRSM